MYIIADLSVCRRINLHEVGGIVIFLGKLKIKVYFCGNKTNRLIWLYRYTVNLNYYG